MRLHATSDDRQIWCSRPPARRQDCGGMAGVACSARDGGMLQPWLTQETWLWRPCSIEPLRSTTPRSLSSRALAGDWSNLQTCRPANRYWTWRRGVARACAQQLKLSVLVGASWALIWRQKMVELLREDLQRLGLRQASAMVGDATCLDLADNEFDVALCGFTLMLLHDPRRAAAELVRVLRPGGRVAVSMPTDAGPEWSFFGEIAAQFAPRAVRPLPPTPGAPVDLAALLREVGFHGIQSLDEVEDFTFTDADEWWRWVWSQGMRALLEALPPDALDDLRAAADKRLQTMTRDGSIPLRQYVRYTLAIKP